MADDLKAQLRRETRDWLNRGVIPSEAAKNRRFLAETVPAAAETHLAFAAEWDRIAAKNPEKVRKALETWRDHYLENVTFLDGGGQYTAYHQKRADEFQKLIDELETRHG